MAKDGPAPRRVTAGVGLSERFPGALEQNPTCRTGRRDLRYGLDLSPFLLPAIIDNLRTNLGKIEQSKSLKTTGFL